MSFRLRALGLLMLVAVAATGATAWLTLRQASRQVTETVAAGEREAERIVDELRGYGLTHGTWDGSSALIGKLSKETGQRIRVTTENDGMLLADSDILAGHAPRDVGSAPPLLVDPRPELRFRESPAHATRQDRRATRGKQTIVAIGRYRAEATYAACLTRAGVEVRTRTSRFGIPRAVPKPGNGAGQRCDPNSSTDRQQARADRDAVLACPSGSASKQKACLQRVFDRRVAEVAPPRLRVTLGARDEAPPSLAAGPTVLVAAGVAAAVLVGALLLSRAVLRPVRALTLASRGVGEGDLAQRVPASGGDEIAELGRAFNRMADSLQASEERQRALVGDVAHELRTPLTNLHGYLEALRDGVLDPTRDVLESLHEEVELQRRVVDDLQDLALAEADALTYHRTDVDVHELLEACGGAHRAQADAAGIELTVAAPGPAHVHADPDRLRQAIGNLVNNALRATSEGGTVTLALIPYGEVALIRVRDTGKGIPEDELPHLFDRFWRADAARGRATGGSGLGLSITRQIVTDHRGTIDVESTVGRGTTFTIVLSTLDAARDRESSAAAP